MQAGELNDVFNEAQKFASKYKIGSLGIPELVVIGGQNSGKSTIVSGFAGYWINFSQAGMATRRPMILQLRMAPEYADHPKWSVQYRLNGRLVELLDISSHDDVMQAVKEANMIVGATDDPVVVEQRFAKSTNITIIDMPGFRDADPALGKDIRDMVRGELAGKPHRSILLVEAATGEVANIASVGWLDDNLVDWKSRTVIVMNKMDFITGVQAMSDSTETFLKMRLPSVQANSSEAQRIAAEYMYERIFYAQMPLVPSTTIDISEQVNDAAESLRTRLLQLVQDPDLRTRVENRAGFGCLRAYLVELQSRSMREYLAPIMRSLEHFISQESSRRRGHEEAASGGDPRDALNKAAQQMALELLRHLNGAQVLASSYHPELWSYINRSILDELAIFNNTRWWKINPALLQMPERDVRIASMREPSQYDGIFRDPFFLTNL